MAGININVNSWNGWTTSSIGTLFSGFRASGVSSLATIASDYRSITDGSYGQLVKAYYEKVDTTSSSTKTKSQNTEKTGSKSSTTASAEEKALADASYTLKNAAEKLSGNTLFRTDYISNSSDGYNREAINSAVKSFADAYNDVLDKTDKLKDDTYDSSVASMLNLTRTYSSALSDIGVTVGSDSKLSVDTDKLSNASISDIKKLFNGTGSYGYSIGSRASKLSESILGSGGYNKNGSLTKSSIEASLFSQYI